MARHIEHSVHLSRPAEDVFAFLTDFANNPRWESGVVAAQQLPPGPVVVGTRVVETRRFLGRRIETTYEVTRVEAPRCLVLQSRAGPVQVTGQYTCVPVAGGTRLTDTAEFETHGFFAVMGPLFSWMANRTMVNNFRALKRILETPGAA